MVVFALCARYHNQEINLILYKWKIALSVGRVFVIRSVLELLGRRKKIRQQEAGWTWLYGHTRCVCWHTERRWRVRISLSKLHVSLCSDHEERNPSIHVGGGERDAASHWLLKGRKWTVNVLVPYWKECAVRICEARKKTNYYFWEIPQTKISSWSSYTSVGAHHFH